MNVLIIGYGSIGKRHEEVLLGFDIVNSIDIVTKQCLENKKTFSDLQEIKDLNFYDYFIIASETNKHYEQLVYLEKNISHKTIFCEKPLFEKNKKIKIINNNVFIGYVLRFHPLLEKLKKFLKNENVLYSNIICGQYLPTWRPNTDYRKSYSAKKDEGGGVLLDLSHEIDYIQWLFGKINTINSFQSKISDLEITSDDLVTFIGKTEKDVIVNLSLDYISKVNYRKILVHSNECTYELDFIQNSLVIKDRNAIEKVIIAKDLKRNDMFEKMHTDALNMKRDICTLKEGMEVMYTIEMVQEQNND